MAVQDRRRAGRVHREHHRVLGDEHPQPPAGAVRALAVFEDPPAGLVGVYPYRGGIPGDDRLFQGCQQVGGCLQRPGYGALGDGEPAGGQRPGDAVQRQPQHVLLVEQPGQEPGSEPAFGDRFTRHRCDTRAVTDPPYHPAIISQPHDRERNRPPHGITEYIHLMKPGNVLAGVLYVPFAKVKTKPHGPLAPAPMSTTCPVYHKPPLTNDQLLPIRSILGAPPASQPQMFTAIPIGGLYVDDQADTVG